MKRPVLLGLPPLTFRAAPPRNKARRFPLISPFESHRGQSLKCSATFLVTLLRCLPEALGGSGRGSREETSIVPKLAIGAGWSTGHFIPPGCRSWHPLGLQGGQSNACGEGRKELQSISESVALTDAGRGPGGRSGCPSPATRATSQLRPCPREGSALLSISGAFRPEEAAERSACCQSPGQVGRAASVCAAASAQGTQSVAASARVASCHKCGAGWTGGQESRACLRGVSFHAPFCAVRARDVRKVLARKAVICKQVAM